MRGLQATPPRGPYCIRSTPCAGRRKPGATGGRGTCLAGATPLHSAGAEQPPIPAQAKRQSRPPLIPEATPVPSPLDPAGLHPPTRQQFNRYPILPAPSL